MARRVQYGIQEVVPGLYHKRKIPGPDALGTLDLVLRSDTNRVHFDIG